MNPSALQRFEQSVRTHGDVEAALDELDQSQAAPTEAEGDMSQRIQNAALRALQEEKQG